VLANVSIRQTATRRRASDGCYARSSALDILRAASRSSRAAELEWMNGSICRTATKTPLIVALATDEHAFTARPGADDRPNAAAEAAVGAGCGGKCCSGGDHREMYVPTPDDVIIGVIADRWMSCSRSSRAFDACGQLVNILAKHCTTACVDCELTMCNS